MRLILLGVVLDIVAVAIIIVLIFLPMAVNDNAGLNAFYARLFCETGERYVPTTSSSPTSDGGTGYDLYAVCVGERGEVDVTPKQTIIGLVAFAVPLLLATGLQFLGAAAIKRRKERPREVTNLVNRPGIGSLIGFPQGAGSDSTAQTLSEKLAEVDEAYESRRISREEYEILRKKIIDSSNF